MYKYRDICDRQPLFVMVATSPKIDRLNLIGPIHSRSTAHALDYLLAEYMGRFCDKGLPHTPISFLS
jgi:hypothetical protein